MLCVCAVAVAASVRLPSNKTLAADPNPLAVTTTFADTARTTTSLSEEKVAPAIAEPLTDQAATTTSSVTEPTNPTTNQSCQRLLESEDQPWVVVNDGVMGGRSQGAITTETNRMKFTGNIVTDGGGFSSVRRLLNDGLDESDRLQLRFAPTNVDTRYSLPILTPRHTGDLLRALETAGDGWQVVDVSFEGLEARIFGRRVDAPSFNLTK